MKTFEQWLMEQQVTPAAPVGAPAAPAAPTPTPAQNQQAQQAQQAQEQPPEKPAIQTGEEQFFITTTNAIQTLEGLNEPFKKIVQTANFYDNNRSQQTIFLNKMVEAFKSRPEIFKQYLAKLQQLIVSGKGYPTKEVDMTQRYDTSWESSFNPDESADKIDNLGSAVGAVVADIGNLTQFGSQSQRSVFGQN